MAQHLPPETLDTWLAAAAAEFGLDAAEVDIATILDVAKDVAHGVARPAAPLSTFLLGVAYGRGAAGNADAGADGRDPRELQQLAARLSALAERWQ